MTIKFSDGMEFNTQGEYRVVHKRDGYYVVGHGLLEAVDSYEDGVRLIEELKKKETKK